MRTPTTIEASHTIEGTASDTLDVLSRYCSAKPAYESVQRRTVAILIERCLTLPKPSTCCHTTPTFITIVAFATASRYGGSGGVTISQLQLRAHLECCVSACVCLFVWLLWHDARRASMRKR